jgi:hypothetical protein
VIEVDISQLPLNEVNFIPVVIDERLQEVAELVWVIYKNLQNLFDFDWLLVRTVRELWSNFLSTGNPDYLSRNDLHMVHESFLA